MDLEENMILANQQWSKKMHDDLLDALHGQMIRGFVDTDKVCISGASYGGYSAMVGLQKILTYSNVLLHYVGVVDLYTWIYDDNGVDVR